jgi:ubiquitin-protein ligase
MVRPPPALHFRVFSLSQKLKQQQSSIPYTAMRRLMRELKELRTNPPEGIRVQLSEESVLDVVGIIEGPGASLIDRAF